MIATHRHPVIGLLRVARHYVQFGNTVLEPGRPTPLLGEQTRQVLEEVGYTEPAIAALYAKGVVKTEVPVAVGSPKDQS
jgi:crotonobetainyl-CoA:carnitine CoA-transferase CaiB-like acyl-CoA transferase